MRRRILLSFLFTVLFVLANGCGTAKNCPVCGTTVNDGYGIIDIIPVPEHNPTGAPGGPFNSFDISWIDPGTHRDYVSDRIGLDVAVFDTINNVAVGIITGDNGVAGAGDNPAPCVKDATGNDIIPPLVSALGNFTRFGCRTAVPGGIAFHIPGFSASHHLGGFSGAQCCASRANGVNPLSCPCGIVVTADGKTMFVGNSSSTVVVFDLTTNPPTVIADIPTGQSPDFDGCTAMPCGPGGNGTGTLNPAGVAPCIVSSQGRALSDPTCADLRADEMSYDETDKILLVANGDPGFPFVTLVDMSHVVGRTGTTQQQHCLPATPNQPYGPTNFPTCILGQIYYDGAPANNIGVAVDNQLGTPAGDFPCPDASTTAPSGVSGTASAATGGRPVPCHHGPFNSTFGSTTIALAGIGGSAFNPNTSHFLVTNGNATTDLTVGTVDEIDPRIGDPTGPVVINSFLMPNCMPTSIVQGPGNNFLVGCADHDGMAFPPNEYVIDGTSGNILATITNVGGVDETWYNPGDNRYYLAARDMPAGPVLGVIDAKTNKWLQNVATNANSHSVAVDPSNNHVFVPLQSGAPCTTQSANGCIGVYAQQ